MNSIGAPMTLFTDSSVSGPDLSVSNLSLFGQNETAETRYRKKPLNRTDEIERREKVRVSDAMPDDVAVHPGSNITLELMNRDRTKLALLDLIHRFSSDVFVQAHGSAAAITKDTAAAARAMFDMILPAAKVPVISPDGEGGLLAVWDDSDEPVLLVVDNWILHLVTAAATPKAQYFEDLPFDGERLPPAVGEAIPRY